MFKKSFFSFIRNSSKETKRILPPARLLVIADLHVAFPEDMSAIKKALKTGPDCVLFLGDIYREDAAEITSFAECPCYFVIGNHDKIGQNDGTGAENIDGKTVSVNGIRILGAACGPKYKDGDFGMRTEEDMRKVLEGHADILVSHESPYLLMNGNRSHQGFQAITDYLEKERPAMHIFGHHHWRYNEVVDGVREICVYKCAVINTSPFGIEYYV